MKVELNRVYVHSIVMKQVVHKSLDEGSQQTPLLGLHIDFMFVCCRYL